MSPPLSAELLRGLVIDMKSLKHLSVVAPRSPPAGFLQFHACSRIQEFELLLGLNEYSAAMRRLQTDFAKKHLKRCSVCDKIEKNEASMIVRMCSVCQWSTCADCKKGCGHPRFRGFKSKCASCGVRTNVPDISGKK